MRSYSSVCISELAYIQSSCINSGIRLGKREKEEIASVMQAIAFPLIGGVRVESSGEDLSQESIVLGPWSKRDHVWNHRRIEIQLLCTMLRPCMVNAKFTMVNICVATSMKTILCLLLYCMVWTRELMISDLINK